MSLYRLYRQQLAIFQAHKHLVLNDENAHT